MDVMMDAGPSNHFYPSQGSFGAPNIAPAFSRKPRPSLIERTVATAAGASVFSISGAERKNRNLINGMYSRLDGETVNGKQVYQKDDTHDGVVCWHGPNGCWMVSSPARKNDNKAIGWAKTFEVGL